MNLTLTAIKRPVFILMLMALAIMGGIIGYRSMRVEENPDVSFGVVTVSTIYPGAGPEEVANLVSKKIEDAVSGVANLDQVLSNSQESVSTVVLQFKLGTNMDAAVSDVRAKVDLITGELPDDVERPITQKLDTSSQPVITMAVSSDSLSNRELRDLLDKKLVDQFSRISGVSQVGVSGGEIREIQVRLKRDALLAYGVGVADVQQGIQAASLNIPTGRIVEGGQEYSLRMLGEFSRVQDLANAYISISDGRGPTGESRTVRLGDLAEIKDTSLEQRTISRLDGKESVVIVIQKAKEGNAVEISKALKGPNWRYNGKSLLQSLEAQYGIRFIITSDDSIRIEESIHDLIFTIGFGILLVVLVVYLFLHNFRGTVIVMVAIPLCIAATLTCYWLFGFTINNMSMLALSLSVGVLVDDAIVVIENIYRHLTMGEDPEEAAINGRAEIGIAAIAITMADVVVFLPIGVMGGILGQFFKVLGLGYVISVLFSLLVSFTVTPMLAARWYRKGEDWEHPQGRFAKWFERMMHGLADGYARALDKALKARWSVFSGGFVILIATFLAIGGSFIVTENSAEFAAKLPDAAKIATFPAGASIVIGVLATAWSFVRRKPKPQWVLMGFVWAGVLVMGSVGGYAYRNLYKKDVVFKGGFFPVSDTGKVMISLDLPPGSSLDETRKVVDYIESIVSKHPESKFVVSNIGVRGGGGFSVADQGTNYASITVTLHEKQSMGDILAFWVKHEEHLRPNHISSERVAGDFIRQIGRIPGVTLAINQATDMGTGADLQLSLQSNDKELLMQTAVKVRDTLASGVVAGVIAPRLSTRPGKPEIRAIPKRAQMADLSVNAATLGRSMRILYEGDNTSKFRLKGEEYDIRVMLDLEDRNNPKLLESVPITFQNKEPIYLGDLATVERSLAADRVERRNKTQEIVVNADLLPGVASAGVQAQVDELLKGGLLPPGVAYEPAGEARIMAQEVPFMIGAFLAGIILVYMVLAALYNNLLYPFIIQLAQPQAMVGALLALMIFDRSLNIVGFIGIIALVGLVGKNAILLVDYTNTLRSRGRDRHEALVESARTRLRPILMTTIALIMGMLPVAMAIGRGSEFRETIGYTIIGGATLSTLLTFFVIPCSYTIFDDIYEKLFKKKGVAVEQAAAPAEGS